MTHLAIIGSRAFSDYPLLCQTMSRYFTDFGGASLVDEVVSGGAAGADSLGARWAKDNGVKLTEYLPDWATHGRKAGFIRNQDIVAGSDTVLAFWDGASKGTGNSLSIAKRLKRPTIIIYS